MMPSRKKRTIEKLLGSFGKLKDASFDFELIEKYFRKANHSEALQVLSDKTCNDLDFEELFSFLDRTHSAVGQQYLYNKLRTIPRQESDFDMDEQLIRDFSEDVDFRLSVQLQLNRLSDSQAFYITTLFQDEHVQRPVWYWVIPLLAIASFSSLILLFWIPKMFLVLISVFVVNLIIHYWNKQNLYQYYGSLPELLRLNGVARQLLKHDRLRVRFAHLPASMKVIDQVRHRMTFFNIEAKLQGDFEVIFWAFLEFFKIFLLLEPLLLFGVLKRLDTKRSQIEEVFRFVGHVDTHVSVASLRKGLDRFCFPVISDEMKRLDVKDVYHPFIPDCVENSISLKGRSVLLTGSNMSGKTSFIRTIGINVLTGLTIHTCFAKTFVMPHMGLLSAIRISDDLLNDKSYYFEEVLTIKQMIDQSEQPNCFLFLLDEIFKGTNTVERISAGKAVLSALNKNDCLVFVSTHDIELADLLKEEYDLYHFSELVDQQTVAFDYKLKEGKLKNRNAIRILQLNQYPQEVIQEAMRISEDLDKALVVKLLV